MKPLLRNRIAVALLATACTSSTLLAIDDIPPVDPKPILQALQALRDQQSASARATRQRFIQEAQAAAGNPARAVELWEEAVRVTQFQGATKESAQFKDWKDKEGDTLKDKEVLGALKLYFNWLALSLQRSGGVEAKALLPAVMAHAREVQVDQLAMDAFDENLKKEKDAAQAGKGKASVDRNKEKQHDDEATKRMHDKILKTALGGSPFVQWMHLAEILKDAPDRKRGGRGTEDPAEGSQSWEMTPGSYDGIYQQIVLPELRAIKDVRVLEYWDYKLRRETDQASKAKLAFDIDKFNQVRRPQLLWNRAQDLVRIGQKNRAINEMFTLIKTNPMHPDVAGWMQELEGVIAPPPAAPASAPAAASAPTSTSSIPAPAASGAPPAPSAVVPVPAASTTAPPP